MTGLVLGFAFGALPAFFVHAVLDIKQLNYGFMSNAWKVIDFVKIAAPILVLVACVFGGITVEKSYNGRYVEQYKAQKATIEASLQSDTLSGLERIQLVQQAADANKELAGYQYDCQQWYGFAVDDRVLNLEPIDISGGAIDD